MNKILSLFDEEYVLKYFKDKLLPLYPSFCDIKQIEIEPYKRMVWETTYHVVIGFGVHFLSLSGAEKKINIVCVAHSNEPRENVYDALNYLWKNKLPNSNIKLPRPLFFSEEYNGTFYRALNGPNFLHYIKAGDRLALEKIIVEIASLFARLHSLAAGTEANFNPINSRIKTVIPGVKNIMAEMSARYNGRYVGDLEKIYGHFIAREEEYFSSGAPLCLIHGDAHPENIIKTGNDSIGLIDFTDFCLGDFARDLGAFRQQIEYKIMNKIGSQEYANKIKDLFLDSYLAAAGIALDKPLQERIDLYYNWTAIRTAIFWFLKFGHDESKGASLLKEVKNNLWPVENGK